MQINATVEKDGTMVGSAISSSPSPSENGTQGDTITYDFAAKPSTT
jgi:hypothetical protein